MARTARSVLGVTETAGAEAHALGGVLRGSVFAVTEKASDEASADLLTQRMQVHEKTAWMLCSLLA